MTTLLEEMQAMAIAIAIENLKNHARRVGEYSPEQRAHLAAAAGELVDAIKLQDDRQKARLQ
ncbi:MAG TPA: hypothetical protein VG873_18360 [Burkholderiales bacterium]|nr:hypothetical protein [Burkholderiales bacterium]